MRFLKTTLSDVTINPIIALVGSQLTYCLDPSAQEPTTHEVALDDVVAKYSQDHGVIAVGEAGSAVLTVETTAISVGYRGSPFVDTRGTARRDSPLAVYRSLSGGYGWPATFILTPHKGCPLADCTLFFCTVAGQGTITVDGQPLDAEDAPLLPAYLREWQPISFTGGTQVQAGGSLALTVAAPAGPEVYLEALAGSLSRIRARDGDVVTLMATDLAPGAQIRIKAGYKYWPGQTDFIVDVV